MKHAKSHSHIKVTESKSLSGIFVYLTIILLMLPFLLFFVLPVDASKQTSELASFPEFTKDDGAINSNYLNELGKYFEDRFAFRNETITANSFIYAKLFGESGSSQVVLGKDDYMFYSASVPDFVGKGTLSNSQLDTIAANLKVMQDNVEASGKQFLFTISPNKNTLYPDLMPYNYIKTSEKHNAERLEPYLSAYGVHYLNMFDVFTEDFASTSEIRYLKHDSHWNNSGALLASNAILTSLGIDDIDTPDWKTGNSTEADLAKMNYPSGGYSEDEKFAVGYNDKQNLTGNNWTFAYGTSVYDSSIVTSSNLGSANNKKLYMYRDSFGNSLIPYLSTTFKTAEYSKLVPYDITAALNSNADYVIVERAERNLSFLAENLPVALGTADKEANQTPTDSVSEIEDIKIGTVGNLVCVSGKVDKYYSGSLKATLLGNNGEQIETFSALKHSEENGQMEFALYLSKQTATRLGIAIQGDNLETSSKLQVALSTLISGKYSVIAKFEIESQVV